MLGARPSKSKSFEAVLRYFWGSFEAKILVILLISQGWNDFTHHQFKDYNVFSVKLAIRLAEKSASKITKVRGGQRLLEKFQI